MSQNKRFAVVGVGQRGHRFVKALLGPHRKHADLVALCDSSLETLGAWQEELGCESIPAYAADDFERMLTEQRVDAVLVLTPDHTHHDYICRAMKLGVEAISEKPLTTSIEGCQQILDTAHETNGSCWVTFNYRYAPWNSAVKQALMDGVIGRITGGTLRHNLGNEHGPSYFHRWHSETKYSGGLLVHKSGHFLDLINWFIGSVPKTVYARGGRHFFTAANADAMGLQDRAGHCHDCPCRERCPYFPFPNKGGGESDAIAALRKEVTGYSRDLCVFRADVDIPDMMHLVIEYENGVSFNYQLTAFGSGESDGVIFGTHGNLQTNGGSALLLRSYYGEDREIEVIHREGGHGGADPVLFTDLFDPDAEPDPLMRLSTHHAGVWSGLIGMGAMISMREDRPVVIRDLVDGLEVPDYPVMADEPVGIDAVDIRNWVAGTARARQQREESGQRTVADTYGQNG